MASLKGGDLCCTG